ncbi:helix-turn-helix domain-containing protein [Paenibacillus oryzisoli]|uniref:helix-turn-helix transcriptional regulator n=1 Tax=Paenibacillus oryzisoli TaxID=1850517 RepID=UPI003D2C775D
MQNKVKYLRRSQEYDVTQEQLAKSVGVSKSTISALERGGGISAELMLRIACYFNKDPREIFFADDVNDQITKFEIKV